MIRILRGHELAAFQTLRDIRRLLSRISLWYTIETFLYFSRYLLSIIIETVF